MLDTLTKDTPSLKLNMGEDGKGADTLMWVQEAIFGHRFVEEQLPYILVLEVLAICSALQLGDDGRPYESMRIFNHNVSAADEHENFIVPVTKSAALRYVLFKDRSLERVAKDPTLSPNERMSQWIAELNSGFRNEVRASAPINFEFLRKSFGDRFEDARQAVRILQGLEIDVLNNRRYTSRFLVPRGANLILNDVDPKFVADRMFFGRGGEMVYLMLNRSSKADKLALAIKNHFLVNKDPVNKIAAKFIPDGSDRTTGGQIGYLPKRHHPAYDRMGEDWLSILELDRLPTPQKFEPLFRITALNLMRYFAERAQVVAGNEKVDPIPLDMLGGRDANLRDVSKSYLRRHRQVIEDAVEAFIREKIASAPAWQAALRQPDPAMRSAQALEVVQRAFSAGKWGAKSEAQRKPEDWLNAFIHDAKRRSRNNISTMVSPLGTNSGFVVARRSAGTWFASSDDFLEALVLAVVKEPKTIGAFLEELYERYGFVIGPVQSREAFAVPPCDISSFEENVRAFERRLTGLGYVKRLSDDCAFVSNVYLGSE
ncbi:hypothetical protein [Nitratireductor sp. ZSWI3]|uniref:hypothetical protein n=1 Tax=Nitratireductor sp. ZSWI3 TaxID=2966359 RepID=UPI00214FF12D|nr:hypothetical protein [Nitratireductor sp. ZSWI3]MCR4266769.1 hypothetical protein [Nitratireductor sp. ZSWI3]